MKRGCALGFFTSKKSNNPDHDHDEDDAKQNGTRTGLALFRLGSDGRIRLSMEKLYYQEMNDLMDCKF